MYAKPEPIASEIYKLVGVRRDTTAFRLAVGDLVATNPQPFVRRLETIAREGRNSRGDRQQDQKRAVLKSALIEIGRSYNRLNEEAPLTAVILVRQEMSDAGEGLVEEIVVSARFPVGENGP